MKDHHPHHPHHPRVDEEEAEDDDGHPMTKTKMTMIRHAGENPEKHDETKMNKPA